VNRIRSAIHFLLATGTKIISGLVVIKFLAWYLGTSGFGLMSQFMGLVAVVGMLAGGGVANGLVKFLSGNQSDSAEGRNWFESALFISLYSSMAIFFVLLVGASYFSETFLQGRFRLAIWVLGCVQFFVGIGSLIIADASSRGESKRFAFLNITGTILGTILIALGAYVYGEEGSAYALVLASALVGILGILMLMRESSHLLRLRPKMDFSCVRQLLSYSALPMAGALSITLAQLAVRDAMAASYSWSGVGLWQGVAKTSDVYMQFVGVILINYALPRMATDSTERAVRELWIVMAGLVGFLAIGFILFLSLQDFLVALVFSEDFLPMRKYFPIQMLGDLLRCIAAAFSFFLIARGYLKFSLMYEIVQGCLFVSVFYLIFNKAGDMAPVYAHVVTYFVLGMIMALAFWRFCSRSKTEQLA